MKRIGVFICYCGGNISNVVDVERVAQEIGKIPEVAFSGTYQYVCSSPGQDLIKEKVSQYNLDAYIVAACSPTLHETTFRELAKDIGVNPYQVEIANIREQNSWVHDDAKKATDKALRIIKSIIEKIKLNEDLLPIEVPVTKKVLIIGAGIAGIQVALDIANAGYKVTLVERRPSIGGHMAQISKTFPTLDCSQCIMTPRMVEVAHHKNIELFTYSEVEDVSGHVGSFKVRIKKNPMYVDAAKCTMCDKCVEVCPVEVNSEHDEGIRKRKAIYIPFPQAVPATYTLDTHACLGLLPLACGECVKVCEPKAINYDLEPEFIEDAFGAIVVATGYELYPVLNLKEYGAGEIPDVINGLQFERLLYLDSATGCGIRRPSDGKVPKDIVFVHCAGSRDPELHNAYCSRICCMYASKQAMLYKSAVPEGKPYIFYIDIRSGGKGYEEFIQRVREEHDATYLRGKVSKIFQEDGKVVVYGADTLSAKKIEIKADLVVLATTMVPSPGIKELAKKLKLNVDEYGFTQEAHPKLRPVESLSAGIFMAGCAQSPRDIPDTVSHASGAASKVMGMISSDVLEREPIIATVDEDLCSGCRVCISVCPYDAREFNAAKNIVEVNVAKCEACGSCVVACPSSASQQLNFRDSQIKKMIKEILREEEDDNSKEV
ncbi:MAG: CoB--CoM heterodisulfide reductase iron-sulfur subunit A family protein [bacterium]